MPSVLLYGNIKSVIELIHFLFALVYVVELINIDIMMGAVTSINIYLFRKRQTNEIMQIRLLIFFEIPL